MAEKILGIDLEAYGSINSKLTKGINQSVCPNVKVAIKAELDDLIRLHYLLITRKVTTVLEFGIGKSTIIIDDALKINKKKYGAFVKDNLRRNDPFKCFTIDNNKKWIKEIRDNHNLDNINYHYSPCRMSTFNDRICTLYDTIPNICPDFIYLDGPDQFSPIEDIRGISTNSPDRLPMSADILAIEHFLLPGTLILIDGRTANARFIRTNLQRDWSYFYFEAYDQHIFELTEKPLGSINKKQIDFCLGNRWPIV